MNSKSPFFIGDQLIWQGGSAPIGSTTIIKKGSYFGKIAWIGELNNKCLATGVEFKTSMHNGCDGTWNNKRLFSCQANCGLFLPTKVLQKSSKKIYCNKSTPSSTNISNTVGNMSKICQKEEASQVLLKKEETIGSESHCQPTSSSSSKKSIKVKSTFFGNGKKRNGETILTMGTQNEDTSSNATNHYNSDRTADAKNSNRIFRECHIDHSTKKQKSGFHNIFSWFSKKQKGFNNSKSNKSSSTVSLNSASNTLKFLPISHSVSVDNPSDWKKLMKVNTLESKCPNGKKENPRDGRSISDDSTQSLHASATSINRSKKRRAPDPPVVHRKAPHSRATEDDLEENKVMAKRKAPMPSINSTLKVVAEIPNEQTRPMSSLSSVSSFNVSVNSTMNGSLPSESVSSSTISLFEKLVGAPYVKSNSTLSPKPWFKRKNFLNSLMRKQNSQVDDKIYDMWMPNMQFANRNLTMNGSKSTMDSLIKVRRCSALSNISELDRAAQEIIEADKQKKEAKLNCPQSLPHFLQQEDINPKEKDNGPCKNITYDQMSAKNSNKSFQENLLGSKSNKGINTDSVVSTSSEKLSVSFSKFNDTQPVFTLKGNKDEHSDPPLTSIKGAIMDPEIFYRLAKNKKVSDASIKLNSREITKCDAIGQGKQTRNSSERSSKNFGLRMNNLFTPDVSIIQEGSESITSSATPLEDVEKDFQALAASVLDNYSDSFSITSDFYSEFKINPEPPDPFESLFTMKVKSNTNTLLSNWNNETPETYSEIVKHKERENFTKWQKLKRGTDEFLLEKEVSSEERNMKWICDSCTLINNPWRLHCDVCHYIRPPRPQRTNDGEFIDKMNDISGASANSEELQDIPSLPSAPNQTLTAKELFAISLEAELQKYFDDPYKNDPTTFSTEESTFANKNTKNKSDDAVDISEIRLARIKKFSFENDNQITSMEMSPTLFETKTDMISTALKEHSKAEFKQKVQEFEYIFINGNKPTDVKCKSQNNSGAVRSAVSLINQWGQMEEGKANKRPNFQTAKKDSFDTFSDSMSDSSTLSDVRQNCVLKLDLDIMSTVNKFDDIAALAEVEQLTRVNPNLNKKKRVKKPLFQHNFPSFQTADTLQSVAYNNYFIGNTNPETNVNLRVNTGDRRDNDIYVDDINTKCYLKNKSIKSFRKNLPGKDQPDFEHLRYSQRCPSSDTFDSKYLEKKGVDSGIISENSTDSPDENVQRRSLSIGPNTFELLSPKEFGCISAHHSERPSPTLELDNGAQSRLFSNLSSDNTDSCSDKERDKNINSSLNDHLTENDSKITASLNSIEKETINEQLKRLENAIAENRHKDAAVLAHELARMQLTKSSREPDKLHEIIRNELPEKDTNNRKLTETFTGAAPLLTVTNDGDSRNVTAVNRRAVKSAIVETSSEATPDDEMFFVEMYIEDRATHQGPLPLAVKPSMTVSELIKMVERDYGFPVDVQRWILGRRLADDEDQTLASYRVTRDNCPVFLYLVAPESTMREATKRNINSEPTTETKQDVCKKPTNDIKQNKINVPKEKKLKFKKKLSMSEPKSSTGSSQPIASHSAQKGVCFNSLNVGQVHQGYETNPSLELVTNPSLELVTKPSLGLVENSQQDVSDSSSWMCPRCTLINRNNRPGCEVCSTERPDDSVKISLKDVILDHQGCIPNGEPFGCAVCLTEFGSNEGVVLRECLHMFCRDCLRQSVVHSEMADVKCPFRNDDYTCEFSLQEREIKDLVSEGEYLKQHEKSIREAAGTMRNIFYCKTSNCKGFCEYEDNVNVFACNVCLKLNCLTCRAQHGDISCKEYQDDLATKQDEEAIKTKQFFDDIIKRGNGIACPKCSVMLVRKWGCDWMRCPMCRSEICWVTRGLRWGPKGTGDTSGGCKCGVNGVKCHPKCLYCH